MPASPSFYVGIHIPASSNRDPYAHYGSRATMRYIDGYWPARVGAPWPGNTVCVCVGYARQIRTDVPPCEREVSASTLRVRGFRFGTR